MVQSNRFVDLEYYLKLMNINKCKFDSAQIQCIIDDCLYAKSDSGLVGLFQQHGME